MKISSLNTLLYSTKKQKRCKNHKTLCINHVAFLHHVSEKSDKWVRGAVSAMCVTFQTNTKEETIKIQLKK